MAQLFPDGPISAASPDDDIRDFKCHQARQDIDDHSAPSLLGAPAGPAVAFAMAFGRLAKLFRG